MGKEEQSIKQRRRLSYRLYPSRSATSPLQLSRVKCPLPMPQIQQLLGKKAKLWSRKCFVTFLAMTTTCMGACKSPTSKTDEQLNCHCWFSHTWNVLLLINCYNSELDANYLNFPCTPMLFLLGKIFALQREQNLRGPGTYKGFSFGKKG